MVCVNVTISAHPVRVDHFLFLKSNLDFLCWDPTTVLYVGFGSINLSHFPFPYGQSTFAFISSLVLELYFTQT